MGRMESKADRLQTTKCAKGGRGRGRRQTTKCAKGAKREKRGTSRLTTTSTNSTPVRPWREKGEALWSAVTTSLRGGIALVIKLKYPGAVCHRFPIRGPPQASVGDGVSGGSLVRRFSTLWKTFWRFFHAMENRRTDKFTAKGRRTRRGGAILSDPVVAAPHYPNPITGCGVRGPRRRPCPVPGGWRRFLRCRHRPRR